MNVVICSLLLSLLMLCSCKREMLSDCDPSLESKYDDLIAKHAAAHGLEPEFVKAVIWKESRFRKDEIGSKGELGLMQLMGPSIKDWARSQKRDVPSDAEVLEPDLNIEIGAWYLSWCGRRFPDYKDDGHVLLLAVYNAGFGRVRDKWLKGKKDSKGSKSLRLEDIGFPTTRDYIRQITERTEYYKEKGEF